MVNEREQKLRDLIADWRKPRASQIVTFARQLCANELEATLAISDLGKALSAEEIADIQSGLSDIAAGRTKSLEQIKNELAQPVAAKPTDG